MKKILRSLLFVVLAGSLFVACNNDDGNGDGDVFDNTFTYDGKTYNINIAVQEYFGNYWGGNSENLGIIFAESKDKGQGAKLFLDLILQSGNKLTAGTYTYSSSVKANSLTSDSGVSIGTYYYDITSGTVNVSLSGDIYSIVFNGTTEEDKALKANYKGKLDWYDESKDD